MGPKYSSRAFLAEFRAARRAGKIPDIMPHPWWDGATDIENDCFGVSVLPSAYRYRVDGGRWRPVRFYDRNGRKGA